MICSFASGVKKTGGLWGMEGLVHAEGRRPRFHQETRTGSGASFDKRRIRTFFYAANEHGGLSFALEHFRVRRTQFLVLSVSKDAAAFQLLKTWLQNADSPQQCGVGAFEHGDDSSRTGREPCPFGPVSGPGRRGRGRW